MSFNWESIIFAVLGFLILYFLLNKFAFGPLFSIMEKRREMVQEQIQSAETNHLESAKLLAEQQQAIEEARKEAYEIVEEAKKASVRQAAEITRKAEQEAAQIVKEALEDIENEKNKAIIALRSQVSAMSVMIASKIIEKQIDEQTQKQLVDQYLNEVGGKS